jgi:hypothetical protein
MPTLRHVVHTAIIGWTTVPLKSSSPGHAGM